jgi:hypothetical protein
MVIGISTSRTHTAVAAPLRAGFSRIGKKSQTVAERDLVVTRLTVQATRKGAFMGAAPTGKKVTFHGMDMVRIKNGRATESWHHGDEAVVLMEPGVHVPAHK